jgi:hypothetical protein
MKFASLETDGILRLWETFVLVLARHLGALVN